MIPDKIYERNVLDQFTSVVGRLIIMLTIYIYILLLIIIIFWVSVRYSPNPKSMFSFSGKEKLVPCQDPDNHGELGRRTDHPRPLVYDVKDRV